MVDTPNLQFRFHEIIKNEPASSSYSEEQESVSILYRTNWVRILVVQPFENPQAITIDVEVSQPYPPLSPSSLSPIDSAQTSNETRKLLEQLMEHIKYILKLESSGFSIDFVGNDCLILASRCFAEIPGAEIFELLLPPSAKE
jgi:hypothetical protein